MLADHLDIDDIYVDKQKISSDSLLVDDIFDSGNTFNKILSHVGDPSTFIFAALFARRGKKYPKQLVYSNKTVDEAYIVFPWDKLESQRS